MIDLHTHSTHSDGSYTPSELVKMAAEAGLYGLALTDHDTTAGVGEFQESCGKLGLLGVPGVEISAEVSEGSMHILGYFIDPTNEAMEDALVQVRGGREERNHRIHRKLHDLGVDIPWEAVEAHAGEDVVGRPHFARAMVAAGHVKTTKEAFDRYLAKGEAAYVDRFRLTPETGLRLIREAGGIPVLAHPFTLGLGVNETRDRVSELREMGLMGIEVHYSEHGPKRVKQYHELCEELELLEVGGSDFHGDVNPAIKLGRGFGNLEVPDCLLDLLFTAAGRSLT